MLSNIERVTKQKIQQIDLPSLADIDAKARARLVDQLKSGMSRPAHPRANEAIEQLINEGHTHRDISMALATMLIDGIDPAAEPRKVKTTPAEGATRPTKDTASVPTKD